MTQINSTSSFRRCLTSHYRRLHKRCIPVVLLLVLLWYCCWYCLWYCWWYSCGIAVGIADGIPVVFLLVLLLVLQLVLLWYCSSHFSFVTQFQVSFPFHFCLFVSDYEHLSKSIKTTTNTKSPKRQQNNIGSRLSGIVTPLTGKPFFISNVFVLINVFVIIFVLEV